eukprot:853365-Prymnesium_polylepis.1
MSKGEPAEWLTHGVWLGLTAGHHEGTREQGSAVDARGKTFGQDTRQGCTINNHSFANGY